jgi:Domain of unknown function (DUF4124)
MQQQRAQPMERATTRRRVPWARPARVLAWGLAAALGATSAWAGIYTCIDSKGRRLTADRPIPECTAKEQQVLNSDGSVRTVVPPTLTAEEKAAKEARERALAEQRLAQQDAARRDRNLVARYPNETAHQRARESALDTVRVAIKTTEARLKDLAQQRKPLLAETEFYQGKPLPPKLKSALDANDASVEAQKSAAATQAAEMGRINRIYDLELDRLRRLWGGAAPGSLGPMTASNATAAPLVPAKAAP